MKKILSILASALAKVGDFLKLVKDKIFRRQAEEERRARMKQGLLWGIIGAAIIILIGGYAAARFWPKPAENASATNPIAEAKITVVTSYACGQACWETQLFVDALTSQGIKVGDKETVYVDSWWPFSPGREIAKQYQITKVPTVIVEFRGANQPDINKFFSPTLGTVVNGKFVLTKILAPYYDLVEKKLKGKIKAIYLTDKSCNECYDVMKHEIALKNLGADTTNREIIDIASAAGQALVNKYKITKVPTVLVSGEVSEYTILTQAWAEVGIVAADGTYIFTNLDLMGDSYRDLTTGKIVKAKPPAATTPAPAATAPVVK